MANRKPCDLLRREYVAAAEAYLASLPLEHFPETVSAADQRRVTLQSLGIVHARRPEVQVFNELLVQYPYGRPAEIRQVVPDNMVVIHAKPVQADLSFDLPLQKCRPFWVLDYVSQNTTRKDYGKSFRQYERELKVPYYLRIHPDKGELILYRHTKDSYVPVKANEEGRYSIEPIELELGYRGGKVRYWFQGELVPLPAELMHELSQLQEIQRLQEELIELRQTHLEQKGKDRGMLEEELAHLPRPLGTP
jgi:Uma2 family endonuclease